MTGYTLNSITAKYPIYRDWKDVPEFIRPGKWVQAKEEWDSKYQIYKPFQVDEQIPLEYETGIMIRSNPDYGIFINCAHIEACEQPADSKEGLEIRIATDSARIAAAVAVLREVEQAANYRKAYSDIARAALKALAILEGRTEA